MIVIDALVQSLRNRGLQVIEQPQASKHTNTHLELWLIGFTYGGENRDNNALHYETITFSCDVISAGVARKFIAELRPVLRTMMELGRDSLDVQVQAPDPGNPSQTILKKLKAHFEKISDGAFDWESEDSPMPAHFRESWRITITYPASIAEL